MYTVFIGRLIIMNDIKKNQIKKAVVTFLKACIPPLVALLSSVMTTLISGDVAESVAVGSVLGIGTNIIAKL